MNRYKKITIRFTQKESQIIEEHCNQLSIKKSTFCREAIFNTTVICKKPSSTLLKELNRIGNNINQIIKYININKSIDKVVIFALAVIEDDLEAIKDAYVA